MDVWADGAAFGIPQHVPSCKVALEQHLIRIVSHHFDSPLQDSVLRFKASLTRLAQHAPQDPDKRCAERKEGYSRA